jgi:hypothetical protein
MGMRMCEILTLNSTNFPAGFRGDYGGYGRIGAAAPLLRYRSRESCTRSPSGGEGIEKSRFSGQPNRNGSGAV